MRLKTSSRILCASIVFCVTQGFSHSSFPEEPKAPAAAKEAKEKREWAQPIKVAGVGNCFKVSADLYRGARPTAEGFRELKKLGIRTVIDLCPHSDKENIGDTGLEYVRIPMYAWHAEKEDIIKFLKVARDKNRGPFFVHCLHGSDRTGVACAAYRVVVCDWSKEEAIKEMTKGPFGFHKIWGNLVDFISEMDKEKLEKKSRVEEARQKVA